MTTRCAHVVREDTGHHSHCETCDPGTPPKCEPCREPGCPFTASYRIWRYTGDVCCEYCHGEPKCETRTCRNRAQRGPLCRLCSGVLHTGEVFFRGTWRSVRDAALELVRDPALQGLKWTPDPVAMTLTGRQGSFEIVLRLRLWTATLTVAQIEGTVTV